MTPSDLFSTFQTNDLVTASAYLVLSNLLYLARRAHLRKTTMRYIWNVRTTRGSRVGFGSFLAVILAWQALVAVFLFTEPLARFCGYASFFYYYPNAGGGGYIAEPLAVQALPSNQRARNQIRLDWHRFKYNIGAIGRNGYRHPPSLQRNLPHIDIPKRGIKHWPWRRRHTTVTIEEEIRQVSRE
jgi:hypothetical protein